MGVVVLASAKGAPGVTTAALALGWAWPAAVPGRRSLVVDADVAGSGIAAGLLQGNTPDGGGLLALAAERSRLSGEALLSASLTLDATGSRMVLLGITDPPQSRALAPLWPDLLTACRELDGADVLVDVGRLGATNEPAALLEGADLAVLVVRSDLASLAAARPAVRRLRELRGPGAGLEVLLVGERDPYPAAEIAGALGVEVIAVLADDPAAARVLSAGNPAGPRFARSALIRSAGAAATRLAARLTATAPTGAMS